MIYVRLGLLLLCCFSYGFAKDAPPWRVGLASRDVTPAEPVRMAGYGSKEREQPYEGITTRLYAKALVIEDQDEHSGLLITTDLIGLTAQVTAPLYERIMKKTGLLREQIVINSSHTHSGPVVRLQFDGDDFSEAHAEATRRYTNWLSNQLVELAVEANAQRSPAQLSWGVGVASFVMNRREATERGIRLGVNPRGLADRSVPVLKIEAADGSLRCVLFGTACHNTTSSWRALQISGDYAGYAQQFLEREFPDAQAMFMQGCGGDANPYPSGTEQTARVHGMTLGSEVQRVLDTELEPVSGPLRTVLAEVSLPLNTDIEEADFSKMEKASGATASVAKQIRGILASGESLTDQYRTQIGLWQFGSGLTFVALPGEVVVDYVTAIEKAIGPRHLWISAYNHDVFGYIPSVRTLEEGGYEMRGVYAGAVGIFSPGIEPVIVNQVRELASKVQRP